MKKINLACGGRFHKDWLNVDFQPKSKNVKKVNLLKRLPFKDNTFDVAYCSHFLEHISPDKANDFLFDVKRILKKRGIFRIVVPDLEDICREYLKLIDNDDNEYKKNWIYIELMDQMVRVKPGGKMREIYDKVMDSKNNKLAKYILKRTGEDLLNKKETYKKKEKFSYLLNKLSISRIINKLLFFYLKLIKFFIPKSLRDEVIIQTSFGERHRWMYDQYSLSKKLKENNFKDVNVKKYNESEIPNFNNYNLDIKNNDKPYKGNSSLYIECKK